MRFRTCAHGQTDRPTDRHAHHDTSLPCHAWRNDSVVGILHLRRLSIIQLLKMKCLPLLFYGLESCPLNISDGSSSGFAINITFSKFLNTKSREILDNCTTILNCELVSDRVARR